LTVVPDQLKTQIFDVHAVCNGFTIWMVTAVSSHSHCQCQCRISNCKYKQFTGNSFTTGINKTEEVWNISNCWFSFFIWLLDSTWPF